MGIAYTNLIAVVPANTARALSVYSPCAFSMQLVDIVGEPRVSIPIFIHEAYLPLAGMLS